MQFQIAKMPGRYPTPPKLRADGSFKLKNKKHTLARRKNPYGHINGINGINGPKGSNTIYSFAKA